MHVGTGRHHCTIRNFGIRPQHQEVISTIDIGNCGKELMPQHVMPSKVVRHLITGGSRVDMPGL